MKSIPTFCRVCEPSCALIAQIADGKVTRLQPDKHLVDLATTCHDAAGTLIARGRALVLARDVAGAFL